VAEKKANIVFRRELWRSIPHFARILEPDISFRMNLRVTGSGWIPRGFPDGGGSDPEVPRSAGKPKYRQFKAKSPFRANKNGTNRKGRASNPVRPIRSVTGITPNMDAPSRRIYLLPFPVRALPSIP
jgi:hypothetical protein